MINRCPGAYQSLLIQSELHLSPRQAEFGEDSISLLREPMARGGLLTVPIRESAGGVHHAAYEQDRDEEE
ncbi:hypothetical protein GCM10012278_63560 [Nonomuraea glycinis]|uniref:Uncharacterized protein n=1 Tax=Nonomuraea glycinis TaxID=2047744 RepID=A0A918AA24_9ACTN|nr:hypothetical protein GCM10012278_63560 [Nonomuraea glycinis]